MTQAPIFCAADVPTLGAAMALARGVAPHVAGIKLGLEFFCAEGPSGVKALQSIGLPVFLDLKLHDIPNTVAGALRSLAGLGVAYVTLHLFGGPAMLRAAVETVANIGPDRPKLLGVSVLTSMDGDALAAVGADRDVGREVARLCTLARDCGLDGVVCSAHEIAAARAILGPDMRIVTPGIRPAGAALGDQQRVMTPKAAIAAGADYLVIGRPITAADDPARAARAIAAELGY